MVRSRMGLLLVVLAMTLASPPASGQSAGTSYFGREVASVAFRADTEIETGKLGDVVLVRAGAPLDPSAVDRSMPALCARGQLRHMRVEAGDA